MDLVQAYKIGYVYMFKCLKPDGSIRWEETIENLIPDDGLDYFLDSALNGGAQLASWYIGLYEAAYTPQQTDDMTSLLAAIGGSECQKYTGGARKVVAPDAIVGGFWGNASAPIEFEFTADAVVRGGFQSSVSTWDAITGLLISAVQFPSPRDVKNGDTLRVVAGIQLTAV